MNPPVFVLTGRLGDIILMLPAFKAIRDRIGVNPKLVVAQQFASVCDGVSYVDPLVFKGDWMDIAGARAFTEKECGTPVVPMWWNDKTFVPEPGNLVLRVHGNNWSVDQARYPHFMGSMYLRSGFTLDEMRSLPLVFDKRDAAREKQLLNTFTANNKKPMLLLNFTGEASPFAPVPEVMQRIQPLANRMNVVRLDNLRATRIYDLLGLMDHAIGMVTIDTATLHLAQASKMPYIAYTRDGWSGSVPRGNCAFEIKYSDAIKRLDVLPKVIDQWIQPKVAPSVIQKVQSAPRRKCWMLTPPRIPLKNVTLWGCCWSSDYNFYSKTIRVLRYCTKLFDFERVLFFSFMPPPRNFEFDYIRVPEMTFPGFNIFVNSLAPMAFKSEFAMSVHEDGFPIRPDLWTDEFLQYDYIGAPWQDGVVGNGGFNIESRRLMQEKVKLPPCTPIEPSDNYVCRVHRRALESKGIRFAPQEVAIEFSTELTGQKWPSFGYHGRQWQPAKHQYGWERIAESEQ